MRWLALVAILGAGCLDQLVPAHKKAEAQAPEVDMVEAPAEPEDLTTPDPGDGGALAAFGQPCATGADCQSGICQTIMQVLVCTQSCTLIGMLDPTCPGGGSCNNNGYCKP